MDGRLILGKNLQRLRAAADMTQEELAEKADIERSYLQKIEYGRSMPTVEVAARIRKALQCSWEALTRGM